jgi:ABC-type transporter Mla subunit MlaD
MADPFLTPLPLSIANDPELAPYFNFLGKVLHDLTRVQAAIEDANDITGYVPHNSGAVTVVSNAATDLDTTAAALTTLVVEVDDIKTQLNELLQALRNHGIIAP